MQSTVTDLQKQVEGLKEKCEDMEGRLRRGNIHIMGIAEQPGSTSSTAIYGLHRFTCLLFICILLSRYQTLFMLLSCTLQSLNHTIPPTHSYMTSHMDKAYCAFLDIYSIPLSVPLYYSRARISIYLSIFKAWVA